MILPYMILSPCIFKMRIAASRVQWEVAVSFEQSRGLKRTRPFGAGRGQANCVVARQLQPQFGHAERTQSRLVVFTQIPAPCRKLCELRASCEAFPFLRYEVTRRPRLSSHSLHCRSQLPCPVSVPSPICVNPAANLWINSPRRREGGSPCGAMGIVATSSPTRGATPTAQNPES